MLRAALLFSTWHHGPLFLRSLGCQWGLTGLDDDVEEGLSGPLPVCQASLIGLIPLLEPGASKA